MDLYEIRKKAKEKKEAEEAEARAAEEARAAKEASAGGEGSAEEPPAPKKPRPKKPRKKAVRKKPAAKEPKEAAAEEGPSVEPGPEEPPAEEVISFVEGAAEAPEPPADEADLLSGESDVPLDELMQRAFEAETAESAAPEEAGPSVAGTEPVEEEEAAMPALGPVVGDEEEEEAEDENIIEYLAFRLSDEEYAVRVSDIKEIIRPQKITMVPRAPEFVEGIFSLRGVIIPVFDIKKRLGFSNTERERTTRILIVSDGGAAQGIIVDRVTGVARLKADTIEPPPAVIGGVEAEYLEGIGRLDGRLLILFNTARVLSMEG